MTDWMDKQMGIRRKSAEKDIDKAVMSGIMSSSKIKEEIYYIWLER